MVDGVLLLMILRMDFGNFRCLAIQDLRRSGIFGGTSIVIAATDVDGRSSASALSDTLERADDFLSLLSLSAVNVTCNAASGDGNVNVDMLFCSDCDRINVSLERRSTLCSSGSLLAVVIISSSLLSLTSASMSLAGEKCMNFANAT